MNQFGSSQVVLLVRKLHITIIMTGGQLQRIGGGAVHLSATSTANKIWNQLVPLDK